VQRYGPRTAACRNSCLRKGERFRDPVHLVGIALFRWPTPNFVWGTAAVAGWVILAASLEIWPDWRFSLLFLAVTVVWVAAGFHSNAAGQSAPINVSDEILNDAGKTLLGLAYLVGALSTRRHGVELSTEAPA